MSIRIIVSMTAVPGKGEALAAAFGALCPHVLQEPGCRQYELFSSREDPDRFVLVEKWDDEASLQLHFDAMRARNFNLDGIRTHRDIERYDMPDAG